MNVKPKSFRLITRAAMTLLLSVLTTMGAWADTETVSYIDADGNEQTVTATVLTGNEEPSKWGTIDLAAGWYVVKGDISYKNQISYGSSTGTIHIILADGAQMAVDKNGNAAILLGNDDPLAIYGQSAGTGRLSVTSDRNAIAASGGITINGGIVSATSTGGGFSAIFAYNGAITINGGQVTATPGDNAMGISTEGTITLGLRSASDFITANGYNGTVNIKSGQTLYAGATAYSGNNVSLPSGTVTLRPYSSDDFSVNDAGTEYTIKTAGGWNVFCDLLAENTKGYFSGKTVQLDADITVTRMAGGDSHDFTGTFYGGGHTLTFSHTATDNYCAPFRHVQGASAETPAVISNLNVVSTVTADDYRHPAGLIALQSGYVSVTDCNVEAHISNTTGTANPTNLYPAALVSQSNNTGVLTVSGCTTTGEIATDGKYAAGLIGIVQNTATIENCRASVTIQSTTSGDGTHGGLVASQSSGTTITITGCLFDGRLLGSTTNKCGGFIGWRGNTATITNSLFAPAEVTVKNDGSATFARNDVDTYNCYYTTLLNDGTNYAPVLVDGTVSPAKWHNGKATRTVAAAADVTIGAVALTGTATQYTVSGITAYSGGGLQRGDALYYGKDDQVSLTLSNTATAAPQGYQYGYTASAGTLSGSTLTMPDQDVTISVNTAALAPIDWATVNEGDSEDPYMIYNKDQLLLLAHRVNGTHGETANTYQGMYFKLGADITFDPNDLTLDEGQSNYEAIGHYDGIHEFKGNFNGDGYTVSGIRINKTGSEDANNCQALFGLTGNGAEIHDVHLTDARITGYDYVAGIVAYNYGTVSGCTVTDSYITCNAFDHGTICARNVYIYDDRLRNNYYHGCTVNGTAVTSGVGHYGSDITDNNGALPAYRLDLGANITTPPGTFAGQTEWLDTPPVSPRLAPENGFTLAGNHYFASGYEFTPGSTLAATADGLYTPRATLGGELLDLYTPTGDADPLAGKAIARLSITADCDGKTLAAALRSDGLQHEVSYIDAGGNTQTAQAIALDGHEAVDRYGDINLYAGTYYAGTDIAYANRIYLFGDVTLILADGKTMTLNGNTEGIDGYNLTIYGQSLDDATAGTLRYNGTENGINVIIYEQHSGNVSITATGSGVHGIHADLGTLRGGTLTVTATATGTDPTGIYAEAVDGTITLGWTRPADRITASNIITDGGTIAVADGQALTDGSGNIYTGTLTASVLSRFAAETTLQPALQLADNADNATQIATLNGIETAAILAGRTLYKDGSWNTLCLPFSVDLTASGTLSGDNVQAMTLNTATSTFADGTLTLNFTDATGQTIPAGTPFIIKWDESGTDITDPVFEGVTVSNATNDATVEGVLTFTGTYAPVSIADGGDNTKLYLGAANTLYYPNAAMTIGTHRAYFQLLGGITAGEDASGVRAFVLNFGDETTGIVSAEANSSLFTLHSSLSAWYTLDGRKLSGKPTRRGLYIHNGIKVVIK